MRYVERDRVEPPAIFGSSEARTNRQVILDLLMSGQQRASQTRIETSYVLSAHPELRQALHDLFLGKCAFCESPLDESVVYRFRPAEGAQPVTDESFAHLYYAWLAEAWQNLYVICPACEPDRPFYFPVAGGRRCEIPDPGQVQEFVQRSDGRWPYFPPNETHVLLDPCYDRKLWRHLRFYGDGIVIPHGDDRRGRETIEHFRLNRLELVQARRNAFDVEFEQLLASMEKGTRELQFGDDRRPYVGAWRLHLRQMLADALETKPREDLAAVTRQLLRRPDWKVRLETARGPWLTSPPAGADEAFAPTDRRWREPRPPEVVTLRNFKSLERISFRLLRTVPTSDTKAPALLILGENAAGKSTILEAIAITLMGAKTRSRLDLKGAKYVLNPAYLGAERIAPPDHAWVELGYGPDEPQTLAIRPTSPASRTRHIAQDFEDGGYSNPIPLFAYGAYRQYLDAERQWAPHRYVRTMFQTNEPLSNPETWLQRLPPARFNMVVRALRAVFSIEGDFEVLERRPEGVVVLQRVGNPENPTIQPTPLGIVSSGFRAVLAMLCDIMQGLMDRRVNPDFHSLETAGGLVLIDEIEAHLHPRWKMAIMRGLRQALPQVTFIATSHDPLCLRGMNPEEVMVLERIQGEYAETELPVYTQALVDLPDNRLWTIEQLLTADFFQLRSTADIEAERKLARMQDKLAANIKPSDDPELRDYLAELSSSLPIGDTEVHRLVQEAIAEFLAKQRTETAGKLRRLKEETRNAIVKALEGAV